jgi:hypothetical protein
MDWVHGLDSTEFCEERSRIKLGRAQAMHYQSTVFAQLLKAIPRGWFEREASRYRPANSRRKRTLSDWGHLVSMVMAQLSGARSLRNVEGLVECHPGALAHLGLDRVARSTLSDANGLRPSALFEAVAGRLSAALAGAACARQALRLIDATRIFAGKEVAAWAKGGVKLHVSFDAEAGRPVWFEVTSERVNDITAAQRMPIEAGATYVFDKGFYDFSFWAALDQASCRFVTRLKKNSPTRTLSERLPEGQGILFDRIVRPSERLSGQRRNPYHGELRLIGVKIEGGRELTLVSNDLGSSAAVVAALYKARWQVELFFKWLKQNLKLAHFIGTSKNAVTIQIMAALIAYLLVRLACLGHAPSTSLQAVTRLLPATLLTRRPFADLLIPSKPPPIASAAQLELAYA